MITATYVLIPGARGSAWYRPHRGGPVDGRGPTELADRLDAYRIELER